MGQVNGCQPVPRSISRGWGLRILGRTLQRSRPQNWAIARRSGLSPSRFSKNHSGYFPGERSLKMPTGWIETVEDGRVSGCVGDVGFEMSVLDVPEDQRVDLEPGRYVSFVNGYLLIDKAIWTTHDIETAKARSHAMLRALVFE